MLLSLCWAYNGYAAQVVRAYHGHAAQLDLSNHGHDAQFDLAKHAHDQNTPIMQLLISVQTHNARGAECYLWDQSHDA